MRRLNIVVVVVAAALACACAPEDEEFPFDTVDEETAKADGLSGKLAGAPTEFDRGPSDSWAALFAQVPNYRTISRALGATWLVPDPATGATKLDTVNAARAALTPPKDPIALYTLQKDKFRFEMAPIFYRGRLDGSARVLVVGQDAATDEALVHRAFIGGTGQKVQNLLNQIGITRSYVATNTFLYSIYEQYDEFTDDLAQTTAIKDFRNQLLDKVWHENKIELIVSFGSAAHDSVRSFRDAKLGGKLPSNVLWVQFMHPGAAAVGQPKPGSLDPVDDTMLKLVAASFSRGYKKIWDKKVKDPTWLAPDAGAPTTRASYYSYRSADVPFADIPFGASPEIGRGGTKSERAQSGLQVQLRSTKGARYMAPVTPFPTTASKSSSGYTATAGELSWEPPKTMPTRHDAGPPADWVTLLATTPQLSKVETEANLMVANDFEHPVWYRGQLGGTPRALVIVQDYGVDPFIAGRAASGDTGQRLQHLFNNVGLNADYVAVSPFPFGTVNVAREQIPTLAATPSLTAVRNQILMKLLVDKQIRYLITVGADAEAAMQGVPFSGTWVRLAHPSALNAWSQWNSNLGTLRDAFGGVGKPYTAKGFVNARAAIPREHLAWGKPLWFGTSGDLSQQPHESWIFWNAPRWMNTEAPLP